MWIIYKSFHISKQVPQDIYLPLFIRLCMNFKDIKLPVFQITK